MAERSKNKNSMNSNGREGAGRENGARNSAQGRMQDEPLVDNDMSNDDLDEEMDAESFSSPRGSGNTVDPIERVAQVYQFLRSPQVETTIRRFVASRKTRQLIAAGLSILEIVVVLLPLAKKLGGRVGDMSTLLRSSNANRGGSRRAQSEGSNGRTGATRALAARSGSSVN